MSKNGKMSKGQKIFVMAAMVVGGLVIAFVFYQITHSLALPCGLTAGCIAGGIAMIVQGSHKQT